MVSPISWVGGKSRLAKRIISHFPKSYKMYVEPFGGSGAVLLARDPALPRDVREVFNDINGDLVHFFQMVRSQAQDLTDLLDVTLYSRQEFRELLKEWIDNGLSFGHVEDPVMRAAKFFALNRQAFGGWMHPSNHGWSFASNPDQTWRVSSFRSAVKRILPLARRLALVQIESMPWDYVLDKYDGLDTLFYMDPPYSAVSTRFYGKTTKGNDYYNVPWTEDDDRRLAERLQNIRGRAIVSYYPCELLDGLYEGWNRITYTVDSFGKGATELLLTNYTEGA